jgi:hypothetical protein
MLLLVELPLLCFGWESASATWHAMMLSAVAWTDPGTCNVTSSNQWTSESSCQQLVETAIYVETTIRSG